MKDTIVESDSEFQARAQRRSWYHRRYQPLKPKAVYQIWIEGSCGIDEPVLYFETFDKNEAERLLVGLLSDGEFAAIVRVDPKEDED